MKFVPSSPAAAAAAASSATFLLLLVVTTLSSLTTAEVLLAEVLLTSFDVTLDKVGFLDGTTVGGIMGGEESSSGTSHDDKDATTNKDGMTTRIIGGNMANKTRYPYFAALLDLNSTVFCGGSLIRPSVVVTAAHCLVGFPPVAAVAVNFTGFSEGRYSHEREVIAVVIHQMYNGKFLYNDIALLILDSPITTEITPIQLDKNNGVPTDNQILKAVGFGATDNGGTIDPDDLMEVELAQKTCENILIDSEDISTLVCAGEGGKNVCFGDSGGPLVLAGDYPNDDVLVGISSFSVGECSEGPSAYTRISAYVDWIEELTLCIDSNAPCTSSPSNTPTVAPTPPPPLFLPGPTANIMVSLPDTSASWYRNVCNGDVTMLLDESTINFDTAQEMKNISVALTTGIYEFVLFDRYGITSGSWSVIADGNIILYQNDHFDGLHDGFDQSGHIVVGDEDSKCPDIVLPGPNAFVDVLLYTDSFPKDTALGYRNLCHDVYDTRINTTLASENYTQYVFSLELSTGKYEFSIIDKWGDCLYDGNVTGGAWSVVLDGNVTLYENLHFVGFEDMAGSHVVIGSGCDALSRPPSPSSPPGGVDVDVAVVPTTTQPATIPTKFPSSSSTMPMNPTPTPPSGSMSSQACTVPVLPVAISWLWITFVVVVAFW